MFGGQLLFLTLFLAWAGMVVLGYFLAKKKSIGGRGGVLLCMFGGLIGIIIILCLPNDKNDWEYNYEAEEKMAEAEQVQNSDDLLKPGAIRELKKWRYLKETGAITSEEFEEKKKEILK